MMQGAVSPMAQSPTRTSCVQMGSAAAVAKKAAQVEELQSVMDKSALMFCVRANGLTVNEMNGIRQKYPEDITIKCVKSTLIKRAVEDYPKFQGGDSLLEQSNYWFFVPEENLRDGVEIWNEFVKEGKKARRRRRRRRRRRPKP